MLFSLLLLLLLQTLTTDGLLCPSGSWIDGTTHLLNFDVSCNNASTQYKYDWQDDDHSIQVLKIQYTCYNGNETSETEVGFHTQGEEDHPVASSGTINVNNPIPPVTDYQYCSFTACVYANSKWLIAHNTHTCKIDETDEVISPSSIVISLIHEKSIILPPPAVSTVIPDHATTNQLTMSYISPGMTGMNSITLMIEPSATSVSTTPYLVNEDPAMFAYIISIVIIGILLAFVCSISLTALVLSKKRRNKDTNKFYFEEAGSFAKDTSKGSKVYSLSLHSLDSWTGSLMTVIEPVTPLSNISTVGLLDPELHLVNDKSCNVRSLPSISYNAAQKLKEEEERSFPNATFKLKQPISATNPIALPSRTFSIEDDGYITNSDSVATVSLGGQSDDEECITYPDDNAVSYNVRQKQSEGYIAYPDNTVSYNVGQSESDHNGYIAYPDNTVSYNVGQSESDHDGYIAYPDNTVSYNVGQSESDHDGYIAYPDNTVSYNVGQSESDHDGYIAYPDNTVSYNVGQSESDHDGYIAYPDNTVSYNVGQSESDHDGYITYPDNTVSYNVGQSESDHDGYIAYPDNTVSYNVGQSESDYDGYISEHNDNIVQSEGEYITHSFLYDIKQLQNNDSCDVSVDNMILTELQLEHTTTELDFNNSFLKEEYTKERIEPHYIDLTNTNYMQYNITKQSTSNQMNIVEGYITTSAIMSH